MYHNAQGEQLPDIECLDGWQHHARLCLKSDEQVPADIIAAARMAARLYNRDYLIGCHIDEGWVYVPAKQTQFSATTMLVRYMVKQTGELLSAEDYCLD